MLNERRIRDYRTMLEDRVRMEAYIRTLRRHASERIVVDLGAGFGPLSLMALQAGAARVYAIETDEEVLAVATQVAHDNGFGEDRFIPILGRSDEITLAERGDLLVTETLDGIGIGENFDYFVRDARDRLLTPEARLIPERVELFVALSDSGADAAERRFWTRDLQKAYGIDFSHGLEALTRHRRCIRLDPSELVTPWTRWSDLDYRKTPSVLSPSSTVELSLTRSGPARGLAFAFRVHLDEECILDTRPEHEATHWQQGWIPAPEPFAVRAGERYELELFVEKSTEAWINVSASLNQTEVSAV